MAKASAGPAPWSHENYWKWREGHTRVNIRQRGQHGVDWSLSSGYRAKFTSGEGLLKKAETWDQLPKKPKTKQVRLFNGRVVEVPDDDFEDFIGHHVSEDSDPFSAIGQYIDKAFENMDRVQDVMGVGHITYIEYVPMYQVLRVEFANDGAVVVFFRVPKEVYSELYHLAVSKATAISAVDGKQRHVLGMRFWDIVRIRGIRDQSKYRYEYAIHGERTGSQFSRAMATDRAQTATETASKTADTDEQLYDGFAKNMLSGAKLDEYRKLKSLKDKEAYLHKAGII